MSTCAFRAVRVTSRARAHWRRLLLGGVAALGAGLMGAARVEAAPPDRGDLGVAYLRFEAAVDEAKLSGEALADANRSFDSLTGAFFAGDFASALRALASATAGVRGLDGSGRDAWRWLAARRPSGIPRSVVAGAPCEFGIRFEILDGVGETREKDAPGTTRWKETAPATLVVQSAGETLGEFSLDAASCIFTAPSTPQTLRVGVRMPGVADPVEIGRIAVLTEELAELRHEYERGLAALSARAETEELADALRPRVALLSETVDRGRSVSLLADLPTLVAQLDAEFARAARAENPFAERRGLHWREHRLLGARVPVARYAPTREGPMPLVIAFHGAGGDECMFFEGYGRGKLRELAEREGFIAVCPATIPFAASPNLLEALVAEIAADLPVDRGRVYLLGHSLGAVTAGRLAALRPEGMRAAGLIAGFGDVARKSTPASRRLWAAELDPIFPASGLARQHADATAAGRGFELTVVPNEGHTLVVGSVLPEVVRWLLAQPARGE